MKTIWGSFLALVGLVSGGEATYNRKLDTTTLLAPIAVRCPGASDLAPVIPILADPNTDDLETLFDQFSDPLALFSCIANVVFSPPGSCDVSDISTSVEVQTCVANFIIDQLSGTTEANFITSLVGDGSPVASDNTGSGNVAESGDSSVFESCTTNLGTFGCTILLSDEERAAITATDPNGAQQKIISDLTCIYGTLDAMVETIKSQASYDPFGTFDIVSLMSDLPSGINSTVVETCSEDPETSSFYESLAVRSTPSPTGAASIQTYTFLPALLTLGIVFLHF